MGSSSRWSDFSFEHPSARLFILGAIDLVVAAAIGLWILAQFRVAGQSDSKPPICSNRMGNIIDCGQDQQARIAAWVVFAVVMLTLWSIHGWRGRRMRRLG